VSKKKIASAAPSAKKVEEVANGDTSTLTTQYRHIPVLLEQSIDSLNLKAGDIFLDATLGFAGHSEAAARKIGHEGILVGIDQDATAREAAKERLYKIPEQDRPQIYIAEGNFGDMDALLCDIPLPGVDAVLFDLGMSSMQIDDATRGFSFKVDAPLDMRMNPGTQTLTAAEVLNTYNAADLTRIIRDNSDEKWASRIAQFVVRERAERPFETSDQLVEVIKAAIPASARRSGGHPAKRTFQALRMEVNDEVGVLKRALDAAIRWVNPGGRIAAISYHSIEDRLVKEAFASAANRCTCPVDLPVCTCGKQPILRIVNKKPILPSTTEIEQNPRARSAKLRVAQKL
jgi:16S rRNA (cytosine1402-N4)-methyltransferase